MKRAFDIIIAASGLLILCSPLSNSSDVDQGFVAGAGLLQTEKGRQRISPLFDL